MIRRDEQARYSIELQGALNPNWADALGGMTIEVHHVEGGTAVTRLVGKVADQAALAGILTLVFTLGMPLLSVACHGRSADEPDTAAAPTA